MGILGICGKQENKLSTPEQMKLFDLEGYYYNENLSRDTEWVFTRG